MIQAIANLIETVVLLLILVVVAILLTQSAPKIAEGLRERLDNAVNVH